MRRKEGKEGKEEEEEEEIALNVERFLAWVLHPAWARVEETVLGPFVDAVYRY